MAFMYALQYKWLPNASFAVDRINDNRRTIFRASVIVALLRNLFEYGIEGCLSEKAYIIRVWEF